MSSRKQLEEDLKFPQLTPQKFNQIYEITSSIHSLRKGEQVHSHLRFLEVIEKDKPDNFEDFAEMISVGLKEPNLYYLRLTNPPPEYQELHASGILPPWPGPGTIYRIEVAPAYKSNTDRKAWKTPMIWVLDSEQKNLLGCSDVFRRVAATHCKNCPAQEGGIASCCHVGFELLFCSAPWTLEYTVNRALRFVNIKNHSNFLHPQEVMKNTKGNKGYMPSRTYRRSVEKR